MSLIAVSDLSFCYEGSSEPVFEHVSFQIDTDWKLGFTGRNGRGKTTFLRLLQGMYEYEGSITASVEFDYFPFDVEDEQADTLEVILSRMPEVEFWRLRRELARLQLEEEVLYRPFDTLSYGEQTKVLLAALFLRENHFLLIDEPTNHLDREGRALLGEYLAEKKGFILVSHDRNFLDACVDHMLSINRADIQVQKGNFSVWYENRSRQDAWEMAENQRLKKEIGHLKEAARRTRNWGDQIENQKIGRTPYLQEKSIGMRAYVGEKSRRMQQRRKNLERRQERAMEEKSSLLKNVETAEDLKLMPLTYHKEVLAEAEDLQAGYGGRPVCQPVSFQIRRGDRISLQGKNGCGKSTILKAILQAAGVKTPEGTGVESGLLVKGMLRTGSGLVISYVPQDTSWLRGSLMEYGAALGLEAPLFLALLAKLDVPREQFAMPMETFSEGQKKKVLLAASLCTRAHLYVWDEPLNYIDVYSRIQIENLIRTWNPSILLVEHDQMFTERIGARTVEVRRL